MAGAQPAMAMKSTLFCLTCVVADNFLDCFTNIKPEMAMIGTCNCYNMEVQW